MRLNVEHMDDKGSLTNYQFNLNYLQFIKHLAFAGMGAHKSLYNFFRFSGFAVEFIPYWKGAPTFFNIPDIVKHDPTELGQISNRIGKALADYLAKEIYGARYTHTYEDVMALHGHKIEGKRPDLYCDTLKKQFAIESKGNKRHSVSSTKMDKYKAQSKQGPISVHFSVASVAYNLYEEPKVKFHDPVGENTEYSTEINHQLVNNYYLSVLDSIDQLGWEPISQSENIPRDFVAYRVARLGSKESLYLLLHESIAGWEWAQSDSLGLEGVFEKLDPYAVQKNSESNELWEISSTYIDVDGIGLCIR